MDRIRIATRRSVLALWQAHHVADLLRAHHPDLEVELVEIVSAGDRDQTSILSSVGGKGLFITALEDALNEGRADVAVHSMKDVPSIVTDGFRLSTIAARADPRDALLTRDGGTIDTLAPGARIGTTSTRRGAIVRALDRRFAIEPLRGNVDTRLKRLDEGTFDAIFLAAAGLDRLGLSDRISQRLSPDVFVPSPGQGALAIEWSVEQTAVEPIIEALVDPDVEACVAGERIVTRALEGDCTLPIGVHCQRTPVDGFELSAALYAADGTRQIRAKVRDPDARMAGRHAAQRLLALGAEELIAS